MQLLSYAYNAYFFTNNRTCTSLLVELWTQRDMATCHLTSALRYSIVALTVSMWSISWTTIRVRLLHTWHCRSHIIGQQATTSQLDHTDTMAEWPRQWIIMPLHRWVVDRRCWTGVGFVHRVLQEQHITNKSSVGVGLRRNNFNYRTTTVLINIMPQTHEG